MLDFLKSSSEVRRSYLQIAVKINGVKATILFINFSFSFLSADHSDNYHIIFNNHS